MANNTSLCICLCKLKLSVCLWWSSAQMLDRLTGCFLINSVSSCYLECIMGRDHPNHFWKYTPVCLSTIFAFAQRILACSTVLIPFRVSGTVNDSYVLELAWHRRQSVWLCHLILIFLYLCIGKTHSPQSKRQTTLPQRYCNYYQQPAVIVNYPDWRWPRITAAELVFGSVDCAIWEVGMRVMILRVFLKWACAYTIFGYKIPSFSSPKHLSLLIRSVSEMVCCHLP